MAYGDLKGTLSGTGNSQVNPTTATGSVVVAVGDLIYVVFGQQTALTVTGTPTDNLGNTYTFANAGNDPGTPTARAAWSIATVAGTLTTISCAATASANNFANFAAVIEGVFAGNAAQPATNPANGVNDITSPFTCPASGTLPEANCVVMAFFVCASGATFAATSPNLLAGQATSSTLVANVMGHQLVAGTGSVSPAFTGTNPAGQSILGTTSFRPVAAPATGDMAATEASDSAAAPEERLYPTNPGPHAEFSAANQTQGVRFTTSANGYILGAYLEIASPVPSGTITMRLANATTTLAEKVITANAASNWKRYDFDSPIAITPGVTYNLYWNYSGSGENRWSATAGVRTTAHLTTSANDFLGSGLSIPNTDVNEDYWVDPIFVTSLGATGTVEWTSDIALTEPSDVASIGGTVTIVDVTGDLAATEAADVAAISGAAVTAGDLAATEAADIAAFSGSSVTAGDLAAVEAADTAAVLGAVEDGSVAGNFAATDAADTAALAGDLIGQGDLAAIEAQDAAASGGEVISQGGLASVEAPDGLAASGELIATGGLAAVEQPDTANAFGAVGDVIAGGLESTESVDAAVLSGQVDVAGVVVAIEAPDTVTLAGVVDIDGAMAANEAADGLLFVGGVSIDGDVFASEALDVAALDGIFLEPAAVFGLVRARAGVIADVDGGLSLVGEPGSGLGLVALIEAKPALGAVIESGSALEAEIGS